MLVSVLRALLRVVLRTLSVVVPQSRSVVVFGVPANEGNAVETARALLDRYDGRVVWLAEGPLPAVVADLAVQGLVVVPKNSLAGLAAYLRAEAVLFTHGLYGSPRPLARKPLVNLWHGDGPKETVPGTGAGSVIPSTYLVGSSQLFTALKGEALGVPPGDRLVTGNPRTDRFWGEPETARLRAVGLEPDGYVVWMPTFRRARRVGAVDAWEEATRDVDAGQVAPLREELAARGLRLVVKPHPFDSWQPRPQGADVVVGDELLARAGLGTEDLLAGSRGLVTDYSSVWVDYLLLDRPIAFLVGDKAEYHRRLVPADVLEWLPGERVDASAEPFARFLADLDDDGGRDAGLRADVVARIGLNLTHTAAADLVDELAGRGVLRLRG